MLPFSFPSKSLAWSERRGSRCLSHRLPFLLRLLLFYYYSSSFFFFSFFFSLSNHGSDACNSFRDSLSLELPLAVSTFAVSVVRKALSFFRHWRSRLKRAEPAGVSTTSKNLLEHSSASSRGINAEKSAISNRLRPAASTVSFRAEDRVTSLMRHDGGG